MAVVVLILIAVMLSYYIPPPRKFSRPTLFLLYSSLSLYPPHFSVWFCNLSFLTQSKDLFPCFVLSIPMMSESILCLSFSLWRNCIHIVRNFSANNTLPDWDRAWICWNLGKIFSKIFCTWDIYIYFFFNEIKKERLQQELQKS